MKRLFFAAGAASFLFGCEPTESEEVETSPLVEPSGVGRAPAGPVCPAATLDPTFGDGGVARLSLKPDDAGGFFALDLVGTRIVAAGWGLGGLGGTTFKVARLRANGSADVSFGGGEVVKTQWGASTGHYAFARAVGHQRDGRVVAVGSLEKGPQKDVLLARYDTAGALDSTTFGADGKPIIDLGGAETIEAGLVTEDDTILAAGSRDGHLLVARFTPDGALDTSFAGGTGYFTAELGDSSTAAALTLDDKGRILVAGSAVRRGLLGTLVIRLTPDGVLDASFGSCSHVFARAPGRDERAISVTVTRAGDIVVAGDSACASGGDPRDFLVRRLREDGSPDLDFGVDGVATGTITDGDDRAESMAIAPGGGILVVGNASGGSSSGPVVARYTEAGELDPSFGTCGVLPLDVGDDGAIHTVVIDSRGRAVIGGGDEGGTPGPGTFAVVARVCL